MKSSAPWWPNSISAASGRNCRNQRSTWRSAEERCGRLAASARHMASNIKPKNPAKEAPTEPFKRAVGVCLRAIAGQGDVEAASAAERPGLAGGKARLPEPPRRLNEREAAIVRGHADSIALPLGSHDPGGPRKAGAL